MDTLYIFIDETGSFSYRDSLSYVGGWVSNKRGCFKKVENKFQQSVKKFNTYLKSKDQNYSLDYPTHTHFMPLHLKDLRTDKDLAIPLVPKYAPVLCQDIFDTLREETLLVFKSSGKPAIIANEQAAYIDILRNTLIQLLDEDQFVDYTHIKKFDPQKVDVYAIAQKESFWKALLRSKDEELPEEFINLYDFEKLKDLGHD